MENNMDSNGIGVLRKNGGRAVVIADAARFLIFCLNKEQYAVPLLKVKEVIAQTDVTPVPYSPPYFKGIMNLRGQVISVIDLRTKLKMPTVEPTSESAIIILDLAPLALGVIVDTVESVLAVAKDEVQPPPDLGGREVAYITGVTRKDKGLILILDIDKTLSVDDLRTFKTQTVA